MNLTFLIPTKLESDDRVRNITTVILYLLSKFDAKIIVKECDFQGKFESSVIPVIQDKFGKIPDNLKFVYEKQEDKFFHKTRILNDLLLMSDTEVVCNYDTDVIIPEDSIIKSYQSIMDNQVDVVYPYGCGAYQKAVTYEEQTYKKFIESDMKHTYLDQFSNTSSSTIGWCQFIRRENYINSFMMNENFEAWGPEDCELYYRLSFLGNRVGRINNHVYHLEHSRSNDSWFTNPMWQKNTDLWNWIRRQTKENLVEYYQKQDYIKRRK